jgi:hypothetical protein
MIAEPAGVNVGSSAHDDPMDRLTIGRLLILTAGVAVGMALFAPRFASGDLKIAQNWRLAAFSVIAGLAISAPLFCLRRVVKKGALGVGGFFALATGLGVWLMLPAAVIEWFVRLRVPNTDAYQAGMCLFYVMPMIGLWSLLGGLVSGAFGRRLLSPATPWIERYGFSMSLLWAPLGVWQVVDVYLDVLSKM